MKPCFSQLIDLSILLNDENEVKDKPNDFMLETADADRKAHPANMGFTICSAGNMQEAKMGSNDEAAARPGKS